MRMSQSFIPTMRQDPGEAEVVSHRLMLRTGMIRKVAAGIYSYLPLGLRAIRKVENIIREEMNRAGAQEVLLPVLSPAELWQETGRWDFYGKELFRIRDRHERDFCLGPTHEEVITDLFRREVRSYRQLPLTMYQIQTKFRDEIRPRFGLMRGREFIMKDAYSFDQDETGAKHSYQGMYDAYCRIFTRTGLKFRPVEADTGLIGGISSHEFMVLANTGEELIVYDPSSQYAANVERAHLGPAESATPETHDMLEKVSTPNATSVEDVCTLLKVPLTRLVKTLLYQTGKKDITAILIRGDHQANEIKIQRFLGIHELNLATPDLVSQFTSAPLGFVGPIGLSNIRVLADYAVAAMDNFIVGGNEPDTHYLNANLNRDFRIDGSGDFRQAQAGDPSPITGNPMETARGIEVGHVFMLGTKYSEQMGATFLDAQGHSLPAIMGCYGIGVGRTVASAVEQNHDEKGICWPIPIAPFQIHIVTVSTSEQTQKVADQLYLDCCSQGLEVLMDDRNERGGVKFNDADLLGMPYQIVIGDKGLARNALEIKDRKSGQKTDVPLSQACQWIHDKINENS
ncbi:MAG: proline--tRNA ligase [Nitrospirales bacterium]|nr:proline--tRNA ligase [Nitrospirales bacterium]